MRPITITIFFSWQSDLPDQTNKNAIRRALRDAARESEFSWDVDEATRGMSGSGNIPDKILEKIRACHVFVADITPINKGQAGRATPNPNVVFELGYAAAHLGWDRIILINNSAIGQVEDAPFDFDRHRISNYQLAEGETDISRKAQLKQLVRRAVEKVIESDPLRPNNFSQFHAERERDGKMLNDLMERIHWPTVQDVFHQGPHRRDYVGVEQLDRIDGLYSSLVFHIYDRELRQLIEDFVDAYRAAISHDECYHQAASPLVYIFTNPGDLRLAPQSEEKWQAIHEGCCRLSHSQNAMLNYVREHYPEVDVVETNSVAWESVRKTVQEITGYGRE